jgi:predicted MPP superfamily phosphohydrolase
MALTQPVKAAADAGLEQTADGAAASDHRERWREARIRMERGSRKHTPFGARRSNRKLLTPVYGAAGLALKVVGLHRPGMANALALGLSEVGLAFPHLPPAFDGLRILHLTDLHLDSLPGLDLIVARLVAGTAPDLAVLTGDYLWNVGGPFAHVLPGLARIAEAARPAIGTFATLGNHDPHGMVEPMERLGLRVLLNETVAIERDGERLLLSGLDDVSTFYTEAAARALRHPAAGFKIALVHSPELAPVAAAAGYALYLCGHTHGGQICLPNGRPIATGTTNTPRAHALGQWRIGAMVGYTGRGAGTSRLRVRFFSRGEATLITLRRSRS